MVHFVNGPDSGDLLRRAEVLPRINKVKIASFDWELWMPEELRGLWLFSSMSFNSRLPSRR